MSMLALLLLPPALAGTTVPSPEAELWFGMAVAGPGDVNGDGFTDALVGAPGEELARAYLYLGGPDGLAELPDQALQSTTGDGDYAVEVSGAGDMDGDGWPDAAVGERSCAGGVYVYPGSEGGLDAARAVYIWGPACDATIGDELAGVGDLDGDGLDDLAVGSQEADEDLGMVLLFFGSEARDWVEPDQRVPGASPGGAFGGTLGTAGDVNGDGYADLLVGARKASGVGEAHLFHGGADGVGAESDARMFGADEDGLFGVALAGLGDVDADGHGDVAVGASGGAEHFGSASLYFGSPDGFEAPLELVGPSSASSFGAALAGPGDGNGDGFADLLVSAYLDARGEGEVQLFRGASAGLASAAGRVFEGAEGTKDWLGFAMDAAGDVNGDGWPDALVTSLGEERGRGSLTLLPGGADADADGWLVDEDCDDADGAAFPGAEETPGDGVDQDCDGADTPGEGGGGGDSGADDTGAPESGGADKADPAGCACSSAPAPSAPWLVAAGLAACWTARRRGIGIN